VPPPLLIWFATNSGRITISLDSCAQSKELKRGVEIHQNLPSADMVCTLSRSEFLNATPRWLITTEIAYVEELSTDVLTTIKISFFVRLQGVSFSFFRTVDFSFTRSIFNLVGRQKGRRNNFVVLLLSLHFFLNLFYKIILYICLVNSHRIPLRSKWRTTTKTKVKWRSTTNSLVPLHSNYSFFGSSKYTWLFKGFAGMKKLLTW
jgi:hypothetical protein